MNIYLLVIDNNGIMFHCLDPDQSKKLMELGWHKDNPIRDIWNPVHLSISKRQRGRIPGDRATIYGTIPVFSDLAIMVLGNFLLESGELLPLQPCFGAYFAYHFTSSCDCLDEQNSEFRTLPSGSPIEILKHSFFPSKIGDLQIFRIPHKQFRYSIYVSDQFVELVRQHHLTGFKFDKVWSSSS
ncbi:MAG: hypothetical protein NW237_14610 [Cyanobacteriota bacterium]|nr:hypothetical protein [Cyanobacteriota bacterium]